MSSKQWFKNFQLDLARFSKKDHRSYAQVVSSKYDSAYRFQHKLHSDTDLQSPSTHGHSEKNHNHVQSAFITNVHTRTCTNNKRTVYPDPVIHNHSRITPQQKQVSVAIQVKRQPKIKTVCGNMPIRTENRFQVLLDNIEELSELDNLQFHTSRGICGNAMLPLVSTPDICGSKVPAKTESSISVDDMPIIDTEVSNKQVMGLSPSYVLNDTKIDDTKTGDFSEIREKC